MKKKTKPSVFKPNIKVDKRLDGVNTDGWFQEKVDKANHILKTVGLPKGIVIP